MGFVKFLNISAGQKTVSEKHIKEITEESFNTLYGAGHEKNIVRLDSDMLELLSEGKPVSVAKFGIASKTDVKQLENEKELLANEVASANAKIAKLKAQLAEKEESKAPASNVADLKKQQKTTK